MKAWYLIDNCTTKRAFMDGARLNATTKEEAVAEMHSTWNALSEHDKRDRDAFWVALFEADEDGIIDFDTEEGAYTMQMYWVDNPWYAAVTDDDNDWGYGSYDLDEAKEMAKGLGGYVAVIQEGFDPICVEEIRDI